MTPIITSFIIGLVTIPIIRWAGERWRTRKDKGYDSSGYGMF